MKKTGTRHEYYVNDRGDLVYREIKPVIEKTVPEIKAKKPAKNDLKDDKSGNGEDNERNSDISD